MPWQRIGPERQSRYRVSALPAHRLTSSRSCICSSHGHACNPISQIRRWKLSARIQSIAHARLFGRPLLPSFLTPPYVTAEPSISTKKIDPKHNDFVILASDGLWDHITSEQAVRLVGLWLARNDPSKPLREERGADSLDLVVTDSNEDVPRFWERLQQGLIVRKPEDLPAPGREYTKVKYGDEKNWVVVDDNAATHLARNALGGADEDLFCALVEASMYPMRKLRCVYMLLWNTLHPPLRDSAAEMLVGVGVVRPCLHKESGTILPSK